MQVSELMNPHVISISPDESAALAARLIARHNIGALPVCSDAGMLRGVVTDRDIITRCVAAEADPATTPVSSLMSRYAVSVSPEDDIRSAAHLMSTRQVRRLPVVAAGRVIGMLSLGDLCAGRHCEVEAAEALAEISMNIRRL